jgi:hypothetical protein
VKRHSEDDHEQIRRSFSGLPELGGGSRVASVQHPDPWCCPPGRNISMLLQINGLGPDMEARRAFSAPCPGSGYALRTRSTVAGWLQTDARAASARRGAGPHYGRVFRVEG